MATCGSARTQWSLVFRPSCRVPGELLVDERTRRAGLRCADFVNCDADQDDAPKRRALKYNAERFMRSWPSANCSCALRAHR